MLERIALHQTRLRTPGLGLDAKGVALGAKGLVLLPSIDRLVAWLSVYTREHSLEDLMPDRTELALLGKDTTVNPESFAIKSEEAQWLRDAVQKLPPEYRIVLVLRDMEGLDDEEVAEITGLRSGTVRVRLHRARLFVRKEVMKGLRNWDGYNQ